jgi:hypothetical protein
MYKLQAYPIDLDTQRRLAQQRAEWRRRQAEAVRRFALRAAPRIARRAA